MQLGEDEPFTDILKEVLHNYGESVKHGIRHVYQSLPRLLTVWYEYGSHCLQKPQSKRVCLACLHCTDLCHLLQTLSGACVSDG